MTLSFTTQVSVPSPGLVRRAGAGLVLLGLALMACSAWSQASELKVGLLRTALALPVHVALTSNHFAAEGVGVRVIDCDSGPKCLALLTSGQVDLATVSEIPVVFASFERQDVAILSSMATSNRNINLVARRSAGISSAERLAGKRIGVLPGSSAQYYLDAYLLFHGVDPGEIQRQDLTSDQMVGAIERREVDAIAGYTRHSVPAMNTLGGDGIMLSNGGIYTESFHVVSTRSVLASREADVLRFLRALDSAEGLITERPQVALKVLQAWIGQPELVTTRLFQSIQYRLGISPSLAGVMESEARWALREGHVVPPGRPIPNYLHFIETAPLRKAVPAAFKQ